MTFQTIVEQHFPDTTSEITFVAQSYDWLSALGFSTENSIPCVGRCRDEITRPLLHAIQITWGDAFDLAALGGLLFAGKTGFTAAIHHAPTRFEREHYLFFAFAHIGINAIGEIGRCQRFGQEHESSACGALIALQQELQQGSLDLTLDPTDIEQSLIRQRLASKIGDTSPDLITLTKLAHEAICDDLQQMLALTVDPNHNDFAAMTGIQIHGPNRKNFVWLGSSYAVVDGVRHELTP